MQSAFLPSQPPHALVTETGKRVAVPNPEASIQGAFVSPDGRHIGKHVDAETGKRLRTAGGLAATLNGVVCGWVGGGFVIAGPRG